MKKILTLASICIVLAACEKKEILPDQSQLDTTDPVLNETDRWVMDNLTTPYNITLRYKWDEFNLSNMGKYNYPTTPAHAARMAKVLKHTWLDAYVETAGEPFVKNNAPRQFTLFGGIDLTPNGAAGAWGQAAGGVNVLLFQVSDLTEADLSSVAGMQQYSYLLHHEYTHILNQNVPFDEENFQKITQEGYTANFHLIPVEVSREEGFISSYARMNIMEDFAEMTSMMLTRSREQWDAYVEQEVVKYTQERDQIILGVDDAASIRQGIIEQIPALVATLEGLLARLAIYPADLSSESQSIQQRYMDEVCNPFISAAFSQPLATIREDVSAESRRQFNSLFTTGIYTSASQLRNIINLSLNTLIPEFESAPLINSDRLSEIYDGLNIATRGRDKIREKERFVVDYFKSKLNIDIYALQAISYEKLSTPITATASPNASQGAQARAGVHESIVPYTAVRNQLMNSRFHVCSWAKQGGEHRHE